MTAITFPSSPTVGQSFTAGNKTWTWDGTEWNSVSSRVAVRTVSDTAPSSPVVGDEWFNSAEGRAYVYYSGVWAELSPTVSGPSGIVTVNAPITNSGTSNNAILGIDYSSLQYSRNAIINGAFDIWQRGTSIAYGSVAGYGADRNIVVRSGWASGATMSQISTGDTTNLPNIRYAARVQRNSGDTSTAYVGISQSLETSSSIPFAGQTATFSFYARKGSGLPAFNVQLLTGTGTDQNIIISGYTGQTTNQWNPALTTTWQRFSYSFTVPATATEIGYFIYWTPSGTAGTSEYFDITGIQLELGSSVTPFTRAGGTLQGELAACQRYYWRFTGAGNYHVPQGAAGFASSAGLYLTVNNPVPMRVPATTIDYSGLSLYTPATNAYATLTSLAIDSGTNATHVTGIIVSGGQSAGTYYRINANNTANAYFGASAELQ
jgi:hypothetical protein